MPRSISAPMARGGQLQLKTLDERRRRQGHAMMPPGNIRNVPPPALDPRNVRLGANRMNGRQLATTLLFATALMTLPRGADANRHRHGHGQGGTFPGNGRQFGQVGHGTHGRHVSAFVGGGQAVLEHAPDPARTSRHDASKPRRDDAGYAGGGLSQSSTRLTADMREGFKRSFVASGNNLGDRLAEGIITRLPGWPEDRPLWIFKARPGGGYETVRTYPDVQPDGRPVKLLLDRNVYVAFDENDVPMAAPTGNVQRGDSFYLAVHKALSPGERRGMGITVGDTGDVSALRGKVAVFSHARANTALMGRLFGQCERDACWLNMHRPQISACATPDREKTIGATHPRAWFTFNVYVHNDVPWDTDKIMKNRLDWWLDEMSGLLPPDAGLRLRIFRGVSGIADLDYIARPSGERAEGDNQYKAYNSFRTAIGKHMPCPEDGDSSRNFHMLLTAKRPYSTARESTFGMALGRFAVACLKRRQTMAHEFGHSLGGTHKDGVSMMVGEYRYCDTAMRSWEANRQTALPCQRYSDKNRKNIQKTLADRMPQVPD